MHLRAVLLSWTSRHVSNVTAALSLLVLIYVLTPESNAPASLKCWMRPLLAFAVCMARILQATIGNRTRTIRNGDSPLYDGVATPLEGKPAATRAGLEALSLLGLVWSFASGRIAVALAGLSFLIPHTYAVSVGLKDKSKPIISLAGLSCTLLLYLSFLLHTGPRSSAGWAFTQNSLFLPSSPSHITTPTSDGLFAQNWYSFRRIGEWMGPLVVIASRTLETAMQHYLGSEIPPLNDTHLASKAGLSTMLGVSLLPLLFVRPNNISFWNIALLVTVSAAVAINPPRLLNYAQEHVSTTQLSGSGTALELIIAFTLLGLIRHQLAAYIPLVLVLFMVIAILDSPISDSSSRNPVSAPSRASSRPHSPTQVSLKAHRQEDSDDEQSATMTAKTLDGPSSPLYTETPTSSQTWKWRMMSLVPFFLTCIILRSGMMLGADWWNDQLDLGDQEGVVRGPHWRADVDIELAIALYDEPLDQVKSTIKDVTASINRIAWSLPGSLLPGARPTTRITIYSKHIGFDERSRLKTLLKDTNADEVVSLLNLGREGETYLKHIVRRYNNPSAPLASLTYFLQPHIAWDWVARPRLERISTETGFVSLGPYLNATCDDKGSEKDSHGMTFPRISQIYSMFEKDLCPPTGFTVTFAGQFVVSKQRILATPLETYANLLGYFTAVKDSDDPRAWIWNEGWHNNVPSNPTLGHWVERSWPAIFRCSQLELTSVCGEESGPHCECRDAL